MQRENCARILDRQRPQEDRVDKTEHRRVSANSKGERKNGDQRECGALAKSPKRVAKVTDERAHVTYTHPAR